MSTATKLIGEKEEKWFSGYVAAEIPSLQDKVIAITGTTSGTGYWTTVAAIRKKATAVFVLNRSSQRVAKSLEGFEAEKEKSESNTVIHAIECDLMSLGSVRKAGEALNEAVIELGGLDVLINNAGIAYFPDKRTEDGFDVQMQVNHLSHFLLTATVYDSLKRAGDNRDSARIVMHSSASRFLTSFDKKYFEKCDPKTLGGNGAVALMKRYAMTKVSNCLFALELNRRIPKDDNVFALLAEPGLATTGIVNKLDNEAKQNSKLFAYLVTAFRWTANNLAPMQSAADGAMPLTTAAFGSKSKPNDFWVPGGLFQFFGVPTKALDNGKSKWYLYTESNITNKASAESMWKLSEKATDIIFLSTE